MLQKVRATLGSTPTVTHIALCLLLCFVYFSPTLTTCARVTVSEFEYSSKVYFVCLLSKTHLWPILFKNDHSKLDLSTGKFSWSDGPQFTTRHLKETLLQKVDDIVSIIRPTSVRCEQTFSVTSRILTRFRTRMSDQTFDSIIFLKFHLIKLRPKVVSKLLSLINKYFFDKNINIFLNVKMTLRRKF